MRVGDLADWGQPKNKQGTQKYETGKQEIRSAQGYDAVLSAWHIILNWYSQVRTRDPGPVDEFSTQRFSASRDALYRRQGVLTIR